VVSHLAARHSRDVVVLAHQELTHAWWDHCLSRYEAVVSEVVLEEVRRGDPDAARTRLEAIAIHSVISNAAYFP